MYAIIITEFGDPEVLTLQEVPLPQLKNEHILVRVRACGVNRADLIQRRGKYPSPSGESDILGLEFAGEVVALGSEVPPGFMIGQRVCGLVAGGAYAEFVAVDYSQALLIPDSLDYIHAACIPEAFMTASECLFTLGELQASDHVLIHAAGSGVGSAAVQLAHQHGAQIYATAGNSDKLALARQLGAQHLYNYQQQDFAQEILMPIQGEKDALAGVDVILDFVGAQYAEKHSKLLRPNGRWILIGSMSGAMAHLDLNLIRAKRLQLKGCAMRTQPQAEKRNIAERFRSRFLPLFATGALKPILDSVYPLREAAKAHQRMEANLNTGKIILEV